MPQRANRAQRRRAHGGRRHPEIPVAAAGGIAPGLPGGPPYVTDREREAVAAEVLAAVEEIQPGDIYRLEERERLGIAGIKRVRYRREEVPGYGKGVVLGEFEEDRPTTFDWKPAPGGGVIFDG